VERKTIRCLHELIDYLDQIGGTVLLPQGRHLLHRGLATHRLKMGACDGRPLVVANAVGVDADPESTLFVV
jgi:hypothetical protein